MTPHLGTCPFQLQTGKKNKILQVWSVRLSVPRGLPAETRTGYLQGCPPAGAARACCSSFPGEGEGLGNHCTTQIGAPGHLLGQSSVEAARMFLVVHHYGSTKPPPLPDTPQAPGQRWSAPCWPALLLANALQFHEGWMEQLKAFKGTEGRLVQPLDSTRSQKHVTDQQAPAHKGQNPDTEAKSPSNQVPVTLFY